MRLITFLSATAFATAMAIEDIPSRVLVERVPEAVQSPTLAPSTQARPKTLTSQGCFSSFGDMKDPKGYKETVVSIGYCHDTICKNSTVFAAMGESCFCGDKYPPKEKQVDQDKCNYPCPAYPQEACTCCR